MAAKWRLSFPKYLFFVRLWWGYWAQKISGSYIYYLQSYKLLKISQSSKTTPEPKQVKSSKAISQDPFDQKTWNFQDFHFSMIQTNGGNFIKFWAGAKGTIAQVGTEWSLHMGHYLIVAHTTQLPWGRNFSFDTSSGRGICYNGKGVPWQHSPP